MLKKTFLILVILLITNMFGISQVKNRIFLKGIECGQIKLSQLSDTVVKITTSKELSLRVQNPILYLTGEGGYQTKVVGIPMNSPLASLRNELRIGITIIIEDFIFKDPKTGVTTFFKGCKYKVIED